MEHVGVKDTHLWISEGCCKGEGMDLSYLHPQFRINEEKLQGGKFK